MPNDIESIDEMLFIMLTENPDLTPDQLTPEMIEKFIKEKEAGIEHP